MKVNVKIVTNILIIILIMMKGFPLMGQVGGNETPLQYSIHTYSIVMDNIANTPSWGVYNSTVIAGQIENNTAVPLIPGTDINYTILSATKDISTGRANFRIQFSYGTQNTPTDLGPYIIGYKEVTGDAYQCVTAAVLAIEVNEPFDVDVTLVSTSPACSDDSDDLRGVGENIFQTAIQYSVNVEAPDLYFEAGAWRFDFVINIDGDGAGTNATMQTITVTSTDTDFNTQTWDDEVEGRSNYTGTCLVDPSSVTPLLFTVVYNDVLGIDQVISFKIINIKGHFSEPDLDEATGSSTGNNTSNTIWGMPNVSDIEGWN